MTTSIAPVADGTRAVTIDRPGARIHRAIGLLAVLGGIAVIVGAWLPWLSLFGGLHPVRGIDGENGQVMVGLGALAVVVGAREMFSASAGSRWVLAIVGFTSALFSGWIAIGVLATVRDLARDPLLVSALGPGIFVVFGGGALLAATSLFSPDPDREAGGAARPTLAALLAIGGVIHLALLPAHAAEGWLGGGFLISGLVQLWLARSVLSRHFGSRLGVVAASSVLFAAAYLLAVTTGLPGLGGMGDVSPQEVAAAPASDHVDAEPAGLLGPVEAVGEAGILTVVAELSAAAVALGVVRRRHPADPTPMPGDA